MTRASGERDRETADAASGHRQGEAVGWMVYILRCGDGSLYTGVSDDVQRRLEAHNAGKGAKYTRGRGPATLVYSEACADRSAALRRELAIKALPRRKKLALIATGGTAISQGSG